MSSAAFRTIALSILLSICCPAQAADDHDLQKKLANPAADLITLPFQLTSTLNTGAFRKPQHTLNVQPVYPVRFGEMKLINRLIVPMLSNPAFVPAQDREDGLGDIVYEGLVSPAGAHHPVWAFGPIVSLRSATDDRLGSGKWSAGPAGLILFQPGHWSAGALVTQLWSFAGDNNRANVSQTQIQPILSYHLNAQSSIGYAGTITANWKEDRSSERWTVPLGMTYSILTKPAGMGPVNYIFGGGYNVVRPDTVGDWFVRFQVNFILTK